VGYARSIILGIYPLLPFYPNKKYLF